MGFLIFTLLYSLHEGKMPWFIVVLVDLRQKHSFIHVHSYCSVLTLEVPGRLATPPAGSQRRSHTGGRKGRPSRWHWGRRRCSCTRRTPRGRAPRRPAGWWAAGPSLGLAAGSWCTAAAHQRGKKAHKFWEHFQSETWLFAFGFSYSRADCPRSDVLNLVSEISGVTATPFAKDIEVG